MFMLEVLHESFMWVVAVSRRIVCYTLRLMLDLFSESSSIYTVRMHEK